jgi:hypothetical protein
MALPTASTPGYTYFTDIYGKRWVACVCLAQWLGVYQRLAIAKKLVTKGIDPWQLTGGAAASAGTHTQGGVFDLLYQTTDAHVALSREMGAPATWRRTVAQGFARVHIHGVLTGCPHNSPARYQIDAQRAGYNGLGTNGRGGSDSHPDPSVYRTWNQGIAWAEAEILKLKPSVPVPPPGVVATSTSLDVSPHAIPFGYDHTLTARISPVTATGTVTWEWHNGDGKWRAFGKAVKVTAGVARLVNRPGRAVDHHYRATFKPSTTAYRGSTSGEVAAAVVDLLALRKATQG